MKALILIVLLAFPCAAVAQEPQHADTAERLQAKVKTFRNGKRFKVQHDKFKDQTWVSVSFRPRGGTSFDTLTASALLRSDGTRAYFLEWKATSVGWRYLEHRGLYAIMDGQRAYLGEGSHDGKVAYVGRSYRDVTVREELRFPVLAADLTALANGKTVEVRIGPTEFRLKEEHLADFRDLLSL